MSRDKMIGKLAEPLDKVDVGAHSRNRHSHVDFVWSAEANVTGDPFDTSSQARL